MFRPDAKLRIEDELAKGETARREGNEGRARVCARRAAGAAIREYLELRAETAPGISAYDLLGYLQTHPAVSPEMKQVAAHMLTQVNEAHALPSQTDLLAEARWLAQALEALG